MKRNCIACLLVVLLVGFSVSSFASVPPKTNYPVLGPIENMEPNGDFFIYVRQGDKWQEAGKISYDKFFREQSIDLNSFLKDQAGFQVRLVQRGGGAAHIDSVFLGEKPPERANSPDGKTYKSKLSKRDFDVIDAYGKAIDLVFGSGVEEKTLSLTARVEGEEISKIPFQFPVANTYRRINKNSDVYRYRLDFYRYRITSKKSIALEQRKPFFAEFSRPGSGHPYGYTYGWVWNDDKYLYVKLDFTPDNTMDGSKDYAAVYVNTGKRLKEFRITMNDTRWGDPEFTYTDKVDYQHKLYHFRIPLREIDPVENRLLLAFSAYGTASAASIIVEKQTYPDGSAQSFVFSTNYGPNFTLSDNQSELTGSLNAGTYSVSESLPSGWNLTSVTCSDGSIPSAINLSADETVTCTFINTQTGTIIIEKQTDPDGSAQTFDFNRSYGAFFILSDGQTHNTSSLTPGTYTVDEVLPLNWNLTSIVCDDVNSSGNTGTKTATILLEAGETVTCTFTNTFPAGTIIVEKQTIPDGAAQGFDFNRSYGSFFILADGQTHNSGPLTPDTYSVSEVLPTGWNLTSAVCDDGSDPSAIDLSADETVTCTFTNTHTSPGTIIVEKQTIPDGASDSFTFTGNAVGSISDGQQISVSVVPGTYTSTETVPAGWNLTGLSCVDPTGNSSVNLGTKTATFVVAANETVTCTFTNTQNGTIIVEKQTSPDGEPDSFTFLGDVTGSIKDGEQIVVGNLTPGTYSSQETIPSGWNLTSIECDDSNSSINLTWAAVTFQLEAGETVTCVFTNTKDSPTPSPTPTTPVIEINKNPNTQQGFSGGTAAFQITVTNSSDTNLNNIVVSDPLVPNCNKSIDSLAPGNSFAYGCSTAPLLSDLTNVATVTAESSAGTVTASDTASVNISNPALIITKLPDSQSILPGETATFTIEVSNDSRSSDRFNNIDVSDTLTPACSRNVGDLLPGRSVSYSCTTEPLSADLNNVAIATAAGPAGRVTATANAFVNVLIYDWGDAPDPTYPTLSASNGARHDLSGLFLGAKIDVETDGQPDILARGDDNAGIDDEDGVVFNSSLIAGGPVNITVTAKAQGLFRGDPAGLLDAWVDFNHDGDWVDSGEQIFVNEPLDVGPNALTFIVPADAVVSPTYARFRFSSAGGLEPTGFSRAGEVEDYRVIILGQ